MRSRSQVVIWGKLWSRSVKSVCSALDPSWGNLHRDDQAGQKSPSHTPGATFKRTETVPPDVSWGFHCFQMLDGLQREIRLSC